MLNTVSNHRSLARVQRQGRAAVGPVVMHFVCSGCVLLASTYRCQSESPDASSARAHAPPAATCPPFSCRRIAAAACASPLTPFTALRPPPARSSPSSELNDLDRSRGRPVPCEDMAAAASPCHGAPAPRCGRRGALEARERGRRYRLQVQDCKEHVARTLHVLPRTFVTIIEAMFQVPTAGWRRGVGRRAGSAHHVLPSRNDMSLVAVQDVRKFSQLRQEMLYTLIDPATAAADASAAAQHAAGAKVQAGCVWTLR
jgi:hypothetical protein